MNECSDGNNTVEDKVERMTGNLISVLQKEQVDAVLLYGDTSSTLSGALAADKIKIPAVHVEAGERNGLINNPEDGSGRGWIRFRRYTDGTGRLF